VLTFVVPGSLHQITGGYLFDRRIVEGVTEQGVDVRVIELSGRFPDSDATAREAAARSLADLPDGSIVVIDGLALPGYLDCLDQHAKRLRLVGFVHHPLSLETGLTVGEATGYAELEAHLWRKMYAFLCPSTATAHALRQAGIPESRIAIAPPGTDKPSSMAARVPGEVVQLLAVGTVCARKGYDVLTEALAPLKPLPWQLVCIGSLQRSTEFAATLRATIARLALDDRVTLCGELPPKQLSRAYAVADAFVLPSFHEGYGMAYAEALAHGLPVIATTAGAITETVPPSAALFVEPGNLPALRDALQRIITDAGLRARLADGAMRAGAVLPDWSESIAHWLASLRRLTA